MQEIHYAYWLANLPGIGNRTIHRLLAQTGSARELYDLGEEQIRRLDGIGQKQREALLAGRKRVDLSAYERMREQGIVFLSLEDEAYPEKLKNIPDPPFGIYVRGTLEDAGVRTVAIVGARRCSEYGRAVAEKLGERLAQSGICVVSGMAAGIDGAGLRGALRKRGKVCAVLGCGVNVCYPPSNRGLYGDLWREGVLVSEYPPETEPLPGYFPARNRIIAGLSDAVVLVEAKSRSGSLITADHALEQGREIYAVPGRIGDALSAGCNMLIRQGAQILTDIDTFLKDLSPGTVLAPHQESFTHLLLEKEERLVYSCVGLRAKTMEELLRETKLPTPQLADSLMRLLQKGFITETFKNCYIRRL